MIEVLPILEAQERGLFDARYGELARCQIAVVEGRTALAGGLCGGVPTVIHLAGPFSRRRVGALLHAFVAEMDQRGYPTTVTMLDSRLRQTPMLRRLCQRLGGIPYAETPPFEWIAFYPERQGAP